MGGIKLDSAEEEGGVVVHVEEVESTIDTGSLCPEDFTDDEEEDEEETVVVREETASVAQLKSGKSTRSMREMSIAASLRTMVLHDEEDEEERDGVLVEEVAKAVSMKRYGSTDLLTEITPERKK